VKSPFRVSVVSLRRNYGHREAVRVHAALPGMRITESWVSDTSPVDVDVMIEAMEGGITVLGSVSAPWEGECRRCLGPVAGSLSATVSEVFVAAPAFASSSSTSSTDPSDEDMYPIEGDHIDLEPMAREAIVLALPLVPLCRPDCLGLCATCGADLNEGPCSCPPAGDSRWAALDSLREKS
jgi:uncharacterized protein